MLRIFTPTHLNVSVTFLSVVEDIIRAFSRATAAESSANTISLGPPSVQQPVKGRSSENAVKKSVAFYEDQFDERDVPEEEVPDLGAFF